MNTNDNTTTKFIIDQCLNTLKREDVKKEFLIFIKPLLEFIILALQPYLYIILLLITIIFLLLLGILALLLHGKFFKTRLQ